MKEIWKIIEGEAALYVTAAEQDAYRSGWRSALEAMEMDKTINEFAKVIDDIECLNKFKGRAPNALRSILVAKKRINKINFILGRQPKYPRNNITGSTFKIADGSEMNMGSCIGELFAPIPTEFYGFPCKNCNKIIASDGILLRCAGRCEIFSEQFVLTN